MVFNKVLVYRGYLTNRAIVPILRIFDACYENLYAKYHYEQFYFSN